MHDYTFVPSSCKFLSLGPAQGHLFDPISLAAPPKSPATVSCVPVSASKCLLVISKSLMERQALGHRGSFCCLGLGPLDHSSKEGKHKKMQALGSSKACLGSGAVGGRGQISYTRCLPGAPSVHAPSLPGRRIDAFCIFWRQTAHSCRTIDSLASLSYLPYFICEQHCNYPPESLKKSAQIEKDWKWAPLAAEKTLSTLTSSLPDL